MPVYDTAAALRCAYFAIVADMSAWLRFTYAITVALVAMRYRRGRGASHLEGDDPERKRLRSAKKTEGKLTSGVAFRLVFVALLLVHGR